MISTAANSDYSKFVPDQVLTSDNLNDLFGYLDEQDRITRTNLIGIGIVCGLKVKTGTDADGKFIMVTKGCGVTSMGYLATISPDVKYYHYNRFDAIKCEYYNKFVNIDGDTTVVPIIPPKTKRFDIWELKQLGEREDPDNPFHDLDDPGNFLDDKVVLLFVELLEENNKNCDPDSCDDKGTKVTVNFRPLLVTRASANSLLAAPGAGLTADNFNHLPDIVMPRWDVQSSNIVNADSFFAAYKAILKSDFIETVQDCLSEAYTAFRPVIIDQYPDDPFAAFNLVNTFRYLYDGSINTNQTLHLQYYHDFFSDLIQAYDEFCVTGSEVISTCCPDEGLFRRHLLLGEVVPLANDMPLVYRHYFMYSPLFEQKDLRAKLRSLFHRMVLMMRSFHIPDPMTTNNSMDENIRITPSKLSDAFISEKALPYYYIPDQTPLSLYKYWSFEKTSRERAHQVLSYNSERYNPVAAIAPFVLDPLMYDIEPYNFLRVEGITGKPLAVVLDTIKTLVNEYRLPVDVVALATGAPIDGNSDDECCCLSDIELQYDLIRKQLLCCLKSNVKYLGSIEKKDDGKGKIKFQTPKLEYYRKFVETGAGVVMNGIVGRSDASIVVPDENSGIAGRAVMVSGNTVVSNYKKGTFIIGALPKAQETTMANLYLRYQDKVNVYLGNLPVPATNTPVENITHYILLIIDEMEELAGLSDEEDIANFNYDSFVNHAAKLDENCIKLSNLLTDYRSTEYFIDKIRLNVPQPQHASEIDKIEKAMLVMSDQDANNIISLLLNLGTLPAHVFKTVAEFIAELEKNTGKYSAQVATIDKFLKTLDRDAIMVIPIKEPDERSEYEYTMLKEKLKNGICTCDIESLKYLLERYKQQKNQLTDVNNFSVYSNTNPGLQHKAGVTQGGTFIIVYKGSNDATTAIPANRVIGDFYLPYTCSSNCRPVEVTVEEAVPVSPLAKPGDDVYVELSTNTTVTLDGSSSVDPDGTIQTYLWEKQSGPAATISGQNTAVAIISNLLVGAYVYKLTVTDNDGLTSSDTVRIVVTEKANIPPRAIAVASSSNIRLPGQTTVHLDGSNSIDPDGQIVSYSWSLDAAAPGANILQPAEKLTDVQFTQPGLFVFKLMVTDNKGDNDTDKVFVLVTERSNEPPIAKASAKPPSVTLPKEGKASTVLSAEGSSDPDGMGLSFLWTLQPGMTGVDIASEKDFSTDVTFENPGVYLFTLTITDDQRATANAYVIVTVNEQKVTVKKCVAPDIPNVNAPNFEELNNTQYKDHLKAIRDFYKEMQARGILAASDQDQINFFDTKGLDVNLREWISDLQTIFTEFPGLRPQAINMLNIHARLTYYIACLQKEDVGKPPVEMSKVLIALQKILEGIKALLFNVRDPQEKIVLRNAVLLAISNQELVRTNDKEPGLKPEYVTRLKAIIDTMNSMP